MTAQLLRYEAARTALAAAHSVDEVKNLRDKAQALAAYARQARDLDMIAWATEIKVRAERRTGELLKELARGKGGGDVKLHPSNRGTSEPSPYAAALESSGLSRQTAHRYQALAAMPEKHFETAVATAKATAGEVTSAHMLRLADEMKKTSELRAEIAAHDCNSRWQVLRHRLRSANDAVRDITRAADTPACSMEEAGRILLEWRELVDFMNEEMGYGD